MSRTQSKGHNTYRCKYPGCPAVYDEKLAGRDQASGWYYMREAMVGVPVHDHEKDTAPIFDAMIHRTVDGSDPLVQEPKT